MKYERRGSPDSPPTVEFHPLMPIGVLYALAAYAAYAFGDAIIKGFGGSLTPFEIAFWVTLFSTIPVLVTKPADERLAEVFKTPRAKVLHLRAAISTVSTILVVHAFTTIPLAEAYALIFLTPVLVTALAVLVLKETLTVRRILGLVLGFAGVLIVVRPGFRALETGHIAALGCAFFASVAAVILRSVSQTEKRITIVGYSVAYALVFNGTILVLDFRLPDLTQLALLFAIGMLGGVGHVLIIGAAKAAPANLLAPTQYSQIVWAIVLGAILYQEYPDAFVYLGLALVAASGLVNLAFTRARTWFGAHVVMRKRQAEIRRSVPHE